MWKCIFAYIYQCYVCFISLQHFPRLRIGIDRPPTANQVTDYVLGRFDREQSDLISQVYEELLQLYQVDHTLTCAGVDHSHKPLKSPSSSSSSSSSATHNTKPQLYFVSKTLALTPPKLKSAAKPIAASSQPTVAVAAVPASSSSS